MASFRKRGDTWTAEVRRKGVFNSGTFSTKAAAQAWATKIEGEIIAGKHSDVADKLLFDVFQKYLEEVSPTKRGSHWEIIRLKKFQRDPIAKIHLRDLNSTHFTDWRDRMLEKIGAGSLLREWNLMSNALKRARDEWKWMMDNPLKPVAKPKKPPARKRIASEDEIAALEQCAGYSKDIALNTSTLRTIAAFLFANETALRAGEICALDKNEVFIDNGYLKVTGIKPGARKNNAAVRDVPLTPRAIDILNQLSTETDSVFNVSVSSLDALFRKVRDRAGIDDLTFHDSRHSGITMLARHYDVLDLARIVGHTNIRELMTYYNPTIEDMVKRGRQSFDKASPVIPAE